MKMQLMANSEPIMMRSTFILMALLTFAPSIAHADAIQLRSRATVTDAQVRLSDVAVLQGDLVAALADTIVARFESSQASISITQDELKKTLTRANVNWARVSLKGFENCQVSRDIVKESKPEKTPAPAASPAIDAPRSPILSNPMDEVSLESQVTIRAHVVQWMRHLHGEKGDGLRITFADRDAKSLDALIGGDRLVLTSTSTTHLGRVPVSIQRFRGEKPVDTLRFSVDVARRQLAVVATRAIGKGAVVQPTDVEVREVFIDRAGMAPVTQLGDAVGQVASQSIRPDTILARDLIRAAVLVKRNDMVAVQALAGGFMVQTQGRALADGGEGDLIEVRNERSRETFTARVVASGRVVITAK